MILVTGISTSESYEKDSVFGYAAFGSVWRIPSGLYDDVRAAFPVGRDISYSGWVSEMNEMIATAFPVGLPGVGPVAAIGAGEPQSIRDFHAGKRDSIVRAYRSAEPDSKIGTMDGFNVPLSIIGNIQYPEFPQTPDPLSVWFPARVGRPPVVLYKENGKTHRAAAYLTFSPWLSGIVSTSL